jgi:ribosome biogenesis GTPase
MTGRITESVAGDYSVECGGGRIITCKARGLFRLKKINPCVGDYVTLVREKDDYIVDEISERRNMLVRPPLANLDCAVIVVSSCEPRPNSLIIDRLTVIFDGKGIESVLVFTKIDKKEAELFDVYQKAGFPCYLIDNLAGETGDSGLSDYLSGKTSALIGNTGVGKTSLLNKLISGLNRPTAEISKKLGRGKHTTRTVELHKLPGGGYIADTPGFSTVETKVYGEIPANEVALHFREFVPFIGKCKFGGCSHTAEPPDVCRIRLEAESGNISQCRYNNYLSIYKEAKKTENEY